MSALSSVSAISAGSRPVARQSMAVCSRRVAVVESRYRGKGTDMSRVSAFERHANDTGSPEAQIARLSARVTQLTTHLQEHNKDYASRRGLEAVLASRKNLLKYLFNSDRNMYNKVVSELGIRDKLSVN